MDSQDEHPINPQHCIVCDGQDGILEEEYGSAYVHPYCKPLLAELPESVEV